MKTGLFLASLIQGKFRLRLQENYMSNTNLHMHAICVEFLLFTIDNETVNLYFTTDKTRLRRSYLRSKSESLAFIRK